MRTVLRRLRHACGAESDERAAVHFCASIEIKRAVRAGGRAVYNGCPAIQVEIAVGIKPVAAGLNCKRTAGDADIVGVACGEAVLPEAGANAAIAAAGCIDAVIACSQVDFSAIDVNRGALKPLIAGIDLDNAVVNNESAIRMESVVAGRDRKGSARDGQAPVGMDRIVRAVNGKCTAADRQGITAFKPFILLLVSDSAAAVESSMAA